MISDTYREKVAQYYYNMGQQHFIKQANPAGVAAALDTANYLRDGAKAATDPKKVGKTPSKGKRFAAGGKAYLESIAKNYLDPRLPKNESGTDAALNIASDLASIVSSPLTSAAPVARTAQRYGKMLHNTTQNMQKRFNQGGIERKAVESYIQNHPKFNL